MHLSPTMLTRMRIAALCLSGGGLVFIIQRIQTKALAAKFSDVNWLWLSLAVLAFGLVFFPAASRWRLALQASGSNVTFGGASCISLIGHFFYTILFGAAGGDTAKSLLYSRWHQVPVTTTLAASSLDRLLGFCGLIIFVVVACALAAFSGGFSNLGAISLRWPLGWLAIALTLVSAGVFWLKRSSNDSPQRHFLNVLKASSQRLLNSRARLLSGIVYGIAVQALLSSVLAFCLAAVAPEPIPWSKLAWTFPLISVVSALPVTFAGLGLRDGAAVMLFSLYGVSPTSAVAASLLAAAVNLIWAVIGATLLWRQAWLREMREPIRTVLAAVPR
jgi:glycosyltransferase 2 family protein